MNSFSEFKSNKNLQIFLSEDDSDSSNQINQELKEKNEIDNKNKNKLELHHNLYEDIIGNYRKTDENENKYENQKNNIKLEKFKRIIYEAKNQNEEEENLGLESKANIDNY